MTAHLLEHYFHEPARYDEMFMADGQARPHWQHLHATLADENAVQIHERLALIEREIRENGVTYNVYADPQGADRPWELDPLPMILSPQEWQPIEQAIMQRATLLNRVLQDIYGEQNLLRCGLIPPALLFAQNGFLRPAHGMQPVGDTWLHVYAADLARAPDGRWWVVNDRTQAPSGAGYALENRLIVSRVFPELFRDIQVTPLAGFFATLRDSLQFWGRSLALQDSTVPFIVLLTPGPYNETYFEHAVIARYLGFPLVEGSDLTVRNNCVWLKTVQGLKRVHVILRRQDADYCDPLELRADSALGVPGLLDCARKKNVLIANALGSGVLETGALLGFLPAISQHFYQETLKLPSVATWWLGEPAAMEQALSHLDQLVIKSADPGQRMVPVFGQDLNPVQRTELSEQIRARPEAYVAQEWVRLSQAPVWDRNHPKRLRARAIGLRVYAVATPQGYRVMPGGLVRVASGKDARVISTQRGGGSKDCWILSEPASGTANTGAIVSSLLKQRVNARDLIRNGVNVSSRVAENLFWFGRYGERCDNAARLLRIALDRLFSESSNDTASTAAVLQLCQDFGLLESKETPGRALLEAATLDTRTFGLAGNLRQLQRVAFSLRERISLDHWRTLGRLTQDTVIGRAVPLPTVLGWLDRAVTGLMTLSGFALDGMTRDEGWRFMSVGRRIERLWFICLSLQIALKQDKQAGLDWLLEVADSIITYRSRYMSAPEWLPTLDLLVLDRANPRSVAFQLYGLDQYLERLEKMQGDCGRERLRRFVVQLDALDLSRDFPPDTAVFQDWLKDLAQAILELSDDIALKFFVHASNRSQLAS